MSKVKHLYDFQSYKDYLNYRSSIERGLKSSLAKATSCQSAYVSQVLNNSAHFSLEQADLINQFFKHSEKESEYFMLLLQKERSGTKSLSDYFEKRLAEFKELQLSYLKRRDVKDSLSDHDQSIYYSTWEYNALHMAITIPRLQSKSSLLKAFALNEKKFNRCMEFLLDRGLVKRNGDHFAPGSTENYLNKNSPFIRQLHLNTRTQAINSLDQERLEDSHISAIITLSQKDVAKVKLLISEALGDIVNVAKHSKEEQIYGLSVDFFDFEKFK